MLARIRPTERNTAIPPPAEPPAGGQGRAGDLALEPIDSIESAPHAWAELAERSGNIFSTREWASIWWRHFGHGRRLHVTACRDSDGDLIGILPLYGSSVGPLRTLRFLGQGPADELGPVCDRSEVERVAGVLSAGLRDRQWPWHILIADRLSGACDWGRLLGARTLEREQSPLLRIAGSSWEGFLAARSSNFREQVRRRERKLAREHRIAFRLADSASLERDFEVLVALHGLRWGGGSPAFAGPMKRFHREFASCALDRGWLRLWLLEVNGDPVAAWYGFRFAGSESYYQSGRDPAWDRYRVGFVLLAHTIREAFNDAVGEYRMLRGGESYKDRFATEDRGVETAAVYRGLGKAACAVASLARRTMPYRVRRRLAPLAG
jgi:CelD/BcsL family acetyltransferase involved in cellulose biosynthesis